MTTRPDVEIIDPCFKPMVLPNAPLELLGEGFRWLEGPVWFADQECLLFSDLPNDRIMRWTPDGGISMFRQPSGFANGHTRDLQGRLIGCSHQNRCITRTELDGRVVVLVDRYEGKRLNSPNDVIVKSDETIWFSDPPYGIQTDYEGGKQVSACPACVYRLIPDTGELSVVSERFTGPNGLCFAPDETRLYVCESGLQFDPAPAQHIAVLEVCADGASLGEPRIFHKIDPGFADGIRCDEDGNVWSSAADGVHCIAPSGELIGKIRVPHAVSNLTFGGRNRSRLFICASHSLFAIYTNQRGAQRP
ncbi:gluconolactonase (plasmid) [Burkholderia sp. PAMC 28687]|uniref:SMP-30/gluconolactonase/LRE family protein n=1 Tax=Burkholderia sp. PAMC 28687 TaxID=1795874 RepID=UPI000780BF0E|nr:SMP-30/gluconolactonase/LRE family protein [Burkholderia sp. PAMC 28687]AMM18647.1 gluconolactonase [Burkholderia sp. PAMC 28687]